MQYSSPRIPFFSPNSFSRFEKILIIVAVALLIVGGAGFVKTWNQPTKEVPEVGGTFTEGIVADSPTKVDRVISSLTNVGLTYRDTDGTIKPALAKSWDITEDNKVYTFHINDGYSAEGLLATIKSVKTDWEGIEVAAPSATDLQFRLPESFGFFLSTTTKPLFPFGPYEVAKREKTEVVLRSNPKFVLGEPHIPKIVLRHYETQEQLQESLANDEITASADFVSPPASGFTEYTLELPRYYVLFPNITRPGLKKVDDRLRIMNGTDGAQVNFGLVTNQSDVTNGLATNLANSLKDKHITLNVTQKNSATMQKEEIPKRQFDLLLYGVSYGVEPDYYPFWHSSQVAAPGLNLVGVKDKELDRLIETARRESDPAKRAEVTKSIEDFLAKNGLQKILSQEKFNYWVAPSIKGVEYGKIDDSSDRFRLVWRWFVKSKRVPVNS